MSSAYTYEEALVASERVNWRIEDLIGGGRRLDFSRPFLPEPLARTEPLAFLTPRERIVLNQIRGHSYLCMFGLVEEFILPFVLDHARPRLGTDDFRVRALLGFASEEAKHIQLFKRFREEFLDGFGSRCDVIGPPSEIAEAVLAHDPLAVALTILHIEWMVQRHYIDSVRDDHGLDPQFKSLLRHHWIEEAQHAKLDELMVEALVEGRRAASVVGAVEEYLEIGGMLDADLKIQTEFDLESFVRATGRHLAPSERDTFLAVQHQAHRWTFIGNGMTHPRFVEALGRISPDGLEIVNRAAPAFC